MLCPTCGNRLFDDGLDDLLYCGACHNYEKKNRQPDPSPSPSRELSPLAASLAHGLIAYARVVRGDV